MAELGYKRSAKKCKEKFENVYKYHKRTKEGRLSAGKPDGKSYRFFDELEAFDQRNHRTSSQPPPPPKPPIPTPQPIIIDPINVVPEQMSMPPQAPASPSSSSTASDEEFQAPRHGRRRKRKWKDFFRRLTGQIVQKQEEMHRRFLDTVARCEAARAARDHAWQTGEASRLDQLARDRAAAASKDAAVLALLNTLSQDPSPSPSPSPRVAIERPINADPISSSLPPPELVGSSSRWPKAEVESLIRIRTTLETKYGENGPKGPLWEEISGAMRRAGYDRSAKRCKEKWENINKYFKKVKDNSKMRSQDSKTCPYFHTLDALYREKTNVGSLEPKTASLFGSEPLSVQPERQWPLLHHQTSTTTATRGSNLLDDDEEDSSGTEVDDDHHHDSNEDQDHHELAGGRGDDSYGIVSKKMDMVE